MTGQDFTDRFEAIKDDLRTTGKGQTVNIMLRNSLNQPQVLPLSSDATGLINMLQSNAIEDVINDLANFVDGYIVEIAPYTAKAAELKVIADSPAYIAARAGYKQQNVSENYAELQNALGSYVV